MCLPGDLLTPVHQLKQIAAWVERYNMICQAYVPGDSYY